MAALTTVATFTLLGDGAARVGRLVLPAASAWWVVGLAAVVLFVVPQSTRPIRPVHFAFFALVLGAGAPMLLGLRSDLARPASPLAATVYRPSEANRTEATIRLEALRLKARKFLNRLTGRRRDVGLEIPGFLWVPREGAHRFELECDDRCSLKLGRQWLADEVQKSTVDVTLEEGIHPFVFRYEQTGGPASFAVSWDRPAGIELLPLQSYVGNDRRTLQSQRARKSAARIWLAFSLSVVWLAAASFLLVRVGQSRKIWWAELRRRAEAWYRKPSSHDPVPLIRPTAWAAAAPSLLILAGAARWARPLLETSALEWYGHVPMRLELALERIEAYPAFLLFLGFLFGMTAIAFKLLAARREHTRGLATATVRGLLLLGTVASLAWGAHVSQHEWVRRGRPCWDDYCEFAETVRTVLRDSSPESSAALRRHLAGNYHANSPVPPALIASLGLAVPDIVTSYRLVSAAATLGSLLLLFRIARRHLALGTTPSLVAVFLFAAAGPIHRSFLFPQTDAVMMFFFTLAVERLLAVREAFTPARYLGLVASLSVALLTKLSALPLVGIAALGVVWPPPGSSWRETMGLSDPETRSRPLLVLSRLCLLGLRAIPTLVIPLLGVAFYMVTFDTTNAFNRELHRMTTVDSTLSLHVAATVATLLPLLISIILGWRRRWTTTEGFLLAAIAIYLLGLWTSGAAGWERFYINVLPTALPLAVARLAPLPGLGSPPHVAVLTVAYAVAHAVRMSLHAFNSG